MTAVAPVELPHPVRPQEHQRTSPFQGLIPYGVADADYFFGRTGWRDLLIDNLLAYRASIFYGASGIGKSSVLSAGVQHTVLERARDNLRYGAPELVAAVYTGWGRDRERPVAGIEAALRDAVAAVSPDLAANPPAGTLAEALQGWSERIGGRVLLMLDQFEEYFLYERQQTAGSDFGADLVAALNRRDLEANFLISLREDSLAKLDRFEEDVPGLLDHLIRIDHLDTEAAREAIEGAVDRWNTDHGDSIQVEPELIREVSGQVQAHRVFGAHGGHGVADEAPEGADAIEAPYLQLVLSRLWDEERRLGSKQLRGATLHALGGVDKIVETHLDQTMSVLTYDERYVAAQVFHYLVTPSGTKIAHTPADLAKYAEVEPAELQPVLTKLAGGEDRVLRAVQPPAGTDQSERYEIFHDVLAPAILDWRTRFISDRARRHNASSVFAGVIHAVLGLLYLYFFFYAIGAGVFTSDQLGSIVLGVWSTFALVWWVRTSRILLRAWRRRYRRLWLVPIVGVLWAVLGPLAAIPIFGLWLANRKNVRASTAVAASVQALLGLLWLLLLIVAAIDSSVDSRGAVIVWLLFSLLWWARGTRSFVRSWGGTTRGLWLVVLVSAVWAVLGQIATIPVVVGWLWRRRRAGRKAAGATSPLADV